jgi:predicted extracellular nuclease
LNGSNVKVEAIVVGDYQGAMQLNGFFIQEEDLDADGDTNTSEGIFVYCDTCPVDVAVGDLVEVTGLAVEFFGMTQIDVTSPIGLITVISGANPLPSEAIVSLPAASSTAAEATFESVEGMLVTINSTLEVSEYFQLARYGLLVLSSGNRPHQFTDTNDPDVAGYAAYLGTLNSSRIILDDDNNIQNRIVAGTTDTPYFWPRPGLSNSNLIRGGDQISNVTGVMHWSFSGQNGTDAWRIRPVDEAYTYNFTSANPRSSVPPVVGGNLKVASFNVLNYFTTLDSRGADSTAELDRQREKIATAICGMNADIVGLIEIENNGATALDDLLNGTNGINAQCANTYAAINTGVIGTDEITMAFIYNTATVSPEGAFAILDSSVDARFNDDKNRPALAQSFKEMVTGATLTVVVNHFKSKGSACDDVGDPNLNDGVGNCNITRAQAAAALADWLATDPTASGDPDFLIIGDLNSYRMEDPIDALKNGSDDTQGTADDYTDLLDSYLGAAAYSYVFDGQLGYLDYAIASPDLTAQVVGAASWHINADEVNVFDYNDGVRDAGEASFERESNALPIYEPNAFRASDHDPVLVGIELVNINHPPVIVCSADINANTNPGLCGALVTFADAIATDEDGDLVSVVQTDGLPSGSEYTATDAMGNTDVCAFTITVTDMELPMAVCQDITLTLDASGLASITAADLDGASTDNCGIASFSASQTAFYCSDVGVNNIVLMVTDIHGNLSSCIALVTVEDITAPTVSCMDITVQLDTNGTVTISGIDVDNGSSDACGIASYDLDIATFDCSDVGDNPVILTVTDVNGNSTTCTAIVTVEDNVAPELVCMDITVELDENGIAILDPNDLLASGTDACGIDTLAIDITEVTCADIGTPITVHIFASDVNGNISTCQATVTVVDVLAPVVTCPADLTVDPGAGNLFYEVPDYFAQGEATATDNCTDPVTILTQDPAPGTLLADGIYTIILTATDAYGNTGTCTFQLTVESILGADDLGMEAAIRLYPNPAEDVLILRYKGAQALEQAVIYDINGRAIMRLSLGEMQEEKTIDVAALASGVYVLQIQAGHGMVVKRFVKE